MQNLLVSIIIPVYKVEPYIVRCIESVLRQTYRNLEVILVDDCTPDQSMEIAKECIANSPLSKDLSFVYLKHDHNRGLSAARNTGMDAATGEYVYFLDSDDEITEDSIEVLEEPLKQKNYDFVVGNYKNIGEYSYYQPLNFEGEIIGQEQIAQSYLERKWYPMAWNKLCRLGYLIENELYFQEGLIHEDELWSFLLACTAQSMFTVKQTTYLYCVRENSITTTYAHDNLQIMAIRYLQVLLGMCQYQKKHNLKSSIAMAIQRKFARGIYRMMLSYDPTYSDYKGHENLDEVIFLERRNHRKLHDFCQIFVSFKKWYSFKVFLYSLFFSK